MTSNTAALAASLILYAVASIGCGSAQPAPERAEVPHFGPGIKMKYVYQDVHRAATLEVEVLNDSQLRWVMVEGPSRGMQSGVEYSVRDIAPGVVFLSWVEDDGKVTTQVVDLVHMEVHTVEATGDGQPLQIDGRVEIVREAN